MVCWLPTLVQTEQFSTNIGSIAIKFGKDIHRVKRMNPNEIVVKVFSHPVKYLVDVFEQDFAQT